MVKFTNNSNSLNTISEHIYSFQILQYFILNSSRPTQPVFIICLTKTILIILPISGEVDVPILLSLNYLFETGKSGKKIIITIMTVTTLRLIMALNNNQIYFSYISKDMEIEFLIAIFDNLLCTDTQRNRKKYRHII